MRFTRLAGALVAAAGLAACTHTPQQGLCSTDADCKEGTHCDTSVAVGDKHACVKTEVILCSRNCGDGFLCQLQPDHSEKCVLETGKGGTAEIKQPTANSQYKGGTVDVVCEAKGPQFRSVRLLVTPPGGAVRELGTPAPAGAPDQFKVTVNLSDATIVEGTHNLGCEVTFGPDDAILTAKANEVPIVVDKTAPEITHIAPTGWHARSGSLEFKATIADTGTGVDPATVKLNMPGVGDVAGSPGNGNEFTFTVDMSKVTPETVESAVSYTISASDKVGNPASQTFSVNVDAVPPTASIDAATQQAWRGYTKGTFTVTAKVSAAGAPVVPTSVILKNADASSTVPGTLSGGDYTFVVDPTKFGHDGLEGPSGWTLEAKDEAGNTATVTGSFLIDGKKPALAIDAVTAWQRRSANVGVTVHASEAAASGSGLDATTVKVRGGAACTAGSGDTFTCLVSTASAPAGADTPAFAYTIEASDKAGNVATADGTLKVDDKAPTLTVTPDGKFYARSASIVVRGNGSDTGSGIDPASVKIVSQTGSKTFTGNYDANSGDITINVLPAQFAPAGQTTTNNVITLFVKDVTGIESSQQITLKIDDQPPTVAVGTLAYPGGGTAILRNASMTITATISDPSSGAGVDNAAVFMEYAKPDGSTAKIAPTGSPTGSNYSFTFDAKAPDFKMDSGTVTVTFDVADLAGNVSTSTTKQVQVTRKVWEFNADSAGTKVNGSVAYAAGKLYFTTNISGTVKDNLFALNASDGTKIWSAKVGGTPTAPVSVGQTDLFFVYTDSSNKGNLAAYPKNPTIPAAPTPSWQCSNIGISNGGLAVATWDWSGTQHETVLAATSLNATQAMYQSGSVCTKIQAQSGGTDPHDSSVAVNGNTIWFGTKATVRETASATFISADESFTNGVVVSSAIGSAAVAGVALRSNGNAYAAHGGSLKEWNPAMVSQYTGTAAQFLGGVAAPPTLAADGTIYFGSDDGYLFKFVEPSTSPATGFPIAIPQAAAVKGSPTVDSAGNVYVMSEDGVFRAYSSSGSSLWTYDTGSAGVLGSSPALSCSGVIYVGTSTGKVIALIADGGGLANSSWPRFQHDNKNTGNLATPIYVNNVCQD